MDIAKPLDAGSLQPQQPIQVQVQPPQQPDLTVILGGAGQAPTMPSKFGANLAEHISDDDLSSLGVEWCEMFDADKNSRKDWEKTYEKGLDLLGLKIEERTVPWPGACGVFHPLLIETLVRFQAQAIMEIFPASGPVMTEVIGKSTPEKLQIADRIGDEMNYILVELMSDYRSETEQLLFHLGLAGSAFRKIYYDPITQRPCAQYVPAEDFVVAYGTTDLHSCERATHVMRRTSNEIKRMQVAGFYRDIELPEPSPDTGELEEKYNKLKGEEPPSIDNDSRHQLLEMCIDCDLPGFEDPSGVASPYVVTVDKQSQKVLSIYRNWKEGDPHKRRRQYYVQWKYLPGFGFYGIGLVHLLGGLAKSATSLLRQLVDAGTLCNLPGGLKTRGLRIKGDSTPIMPGEWRDVDSPSGVIRDSIMPLPYKEPSAVLAQLLQEIVDEGRRIGSVADLQVAETNQQAPVGTTLALLERAMKVMSAVQARLHDALKHEFKLIANIIRDDMPDQYITYADPGISRKRDFAASVAVLPVSDPNSSTTGQRILMYQAAMQMAMQAPMLYDLPDLHRQVLSTMGMRNVDQLVKNPGDMQPMDPVSENMAFLTGKPAKAFIWQDHDSHIQVHMLAMQDPKMQQMVGQSPQANMVSGATMSHIAEHLAFKYRAEIEKQMGVQLPPPDQPLPPQIEVQLSKLVADAASKLFKKDQAEAAQQHAQQTMQDPVWQQQQQELQLKQQDLQRKTQADQTKAQIERAKLIQQGVLERQRLASKEKVSGAQIGQQIGAELLGHVQAAEKLKKETKNESK